MIKMARKKKSLGSIILKGLGKGVWFILKNISIGIGRSIVWITKKSVKAGSNSIKQTKKKIKQKKIEAKQPKINADLKDFEIKKQIKGKLDDFEHRLFKNSLKTHLQWQSRTYYNFHP